MRYPGIQGIGVAEFVNRSEIQKHVEEIRAEGFPEYAIRPDGDRKVYAPVIYLEPFDGADISEHSLMYESSGTREKSSGEKENPLAQKKVVDLYGHQWTLVFSKLNSPGGYFEAYQPIPILVLGCSIALLAFLYMRSLDRTEEKAFVMAKDITTELRQNEIALKNSNRALRMISLCNEKLIRATDESELMRDICRIAVTEGGYVCAWVGIAEKDEEKSVRVAVQHGFSDGYLDNIWGRSNGNGHPRWCHYGCERF